MYDAVERVHRARYKLANKAVSVPCRASSLCAPLLTLSKGNQGKLKGNVLVNLRNLVPEKVQDKIKQKIEVPIL